MVYSWFYLSTFTANPDRCPPGSLRWPSGGPLSKAAAVARHTALATSTAWDGAAVPMETHGWGITCRKNSWWTWWMDIHHH